MSSSSSSSSSSTACDLCCATIRPDSPLVTGKEDANSEEEAPGVPSLVRSLTDLVRISAAHRPSADFGPRLPPGVSASLLSATPVLALWNTKLLLAGVLTTGGLLVGDQLDAREVASSSSSSSGSPSSDTSTSSWMPPCMYFAATVSTFGALLTLPSCGRLSTDGKVAGEAAGTVSLCGVAAPGLKSSLARSAPEASHPSVKGDEAPSASSGPKNSSPGTIPRHSSLCESAGSGGALSATTISLRSVPAPLVRAPRSTARFSLSSCVSRSRLSLSSCFRQASLSRSSSSHLARSHIAACCSMAASLSSFFLNQPL
mmetsp:Transcript_22473/g.49800  ORF Transcript_22473/g.49800 Transcript_22473/m.49800 type:complete len:315 (+) Transcript_22473:855-1799(+)